MPASPPGVPVEGAAPPPPTDIAPPGKTA